ncbi:Small EDRK-rich protein H4F5 [Ceraceosorus bombacis]|uniref:Small EDRK-rich protein H4F5 n=1 Tax=Ceraceosorus bombacis TaxID=401625 RepID=A0A0P1BTM4_9BASI|nr:Small EDRK-rich protein H4F5 [Ceraceosorus bombacis]
MTRGNQRDLARAKNAKKQEAAGKGKKDTGGLTLAQQRQRDLEIVHAKQAAFEKAKAEKEAAELEAKRAAAAAKR